MQGGAPVRPQVGVNIYHGAQLWQSVPPPSVGDLGASWIRTIAFLPQSRMGPNFQSILQKFMTFQRCLVLAPIGFYPVTGADWTLEHWKSYVETVVRTHPRVRAWEILNEPAILSAGGQFNGYLASHGVSGYVDLMREAYAIIKGLSPSAWVLGLGGQPVYDAAQYLDQYEAGRYTDSPEFRFAQQVWSQGGGSYCDAISLHAYSAQWMLDEHPRVGARTSRLTVRQIWSSQVQAYAQLTGKPVWYTEVGIPANDGTSGPAPGSPPLVLGNSPARQALFLSQALPFLASLPRTEAVFWWDLIGASPPNGGIQGLDYGLFEPNASPRPAAAALRAFARG